MTVALNRAYAGYAAGTNASFDTPTETALVQQGLASVTAALPTAGAVFTTQPAGIAVVGAGQISVVITNPNVTTQSKVNATMSNSTADATALDVVRVTPAAGSFTIYLNAAATAAVPVLWNLENVSGLTAVN
jgi:hypothetical protein